MKTQPNRAWYWLLLVPYVAMLWVGSYNSAEPSWLGFPFFYWYQLAWVPLSSLTIFIVYRLTRPDTTSEAA